MLKEYEKVKDLHLPIIGISRHFITEKKPIPSIKDSKDGYLVIQLEKFIPLSATDDNVEKLREIIQHYGIKEPKLGDFDIGMTSGKTVLINLEPFLK